MSSVIRRIEKRIMKKAGYTRENWIVVKGKPVDVRRDGEITDPDDNPIGRDWPRRVPARAKMPTKPAKRAFNGAYRDGRKERGQRRGKHSRAWIESRQIAVRP